VAPSVHSYEDLQTTDSLWISHEHPDHFHIPTLVRLLDTQTPPRVLYSKRSDAKVVSWLKKRDTQCDEMNELEWTHVSGNVRVMAGRVDQDDTWLAVDDGEHVLLNLNDCILDDEKSIRTVLRAIGKEIDVLVTQFSYASWLGNPDEPEKRRKYAKRVLQRLALQASILDPQWVIPGASFAYFCCTDNAYCNDSTNQVQAAVDTIVNIAKTPVVMVPGDCWTVGNYPENSMKLEAWGRHYEASSNRPLDKRPSVSMENLIHSSRRFRKIVRQSNGRLRNWLMHASVARPIVIHLVDLDKWVRLSLVAPLRILPGPRKDHALSLASDSLDFIFRHEWGGSTLMVNGRFVVNRAMENHPGGFKDFEIIVNQRLANNHGRRREPSLKWLTTQLLRRRLESD
jgi:UDP-MurNAc hydroxylase